MKKILFVGDDLYNNGQEAINEMRRDDYGEEDIRNIQGLKAANNGIFLLVSSKNIIHKLEVEGKVCRTYQSFLDELDNLENYDHIVVDLNFPGGNEEVVEEFKSFLEKIEIVNIGAMIREQMVSAVSKEMILESKYSRENNFGPLVVKKLMDLGKKNFTIFTRDAAHSTGSMALLTSMLDHEELADFINSIDKFDNMKYDGEFLQFSSSKIIAAGTKYSLQTWLDFLKEI